MANTGPSLNGEIQITDIPMTANDITFAFNVKTWKALIQADADSTTIYASPTTSSSIGGFKVPTVNKAPALELVNVAGQTWTFNGTNATNLQIMEFLTQ